jgi:hypothetical protein
MDSNIGLRIACLVYILISIFNLCMAVPAFILTWKKNLFKSKQDKIGTTILFFFAATVTGIVLFISFLGLLGLIF